ncbi:MAG: HAD-IA family hydrolase [Terrimicrobiaceae bacterium]
MIIFDFDGTIGDTLEVGLEIANLLAGEFGFRRLEGEDVAKARNMRTAQLLKFLQVPTRKLRKISMRGTAELHQRMHEIQPLPGVPEVVRELHARGYRLGIVTSNTAENVRIFLRQHDLELFAFIRSSSKLLGKAREIRKALKEAGAARHEVLFVGDETRDIEACQKVKIRIAAVEWGYNTPESLTLLKPEYQCSDPQSLLGLLPPLAQNENNA